MAVRSEIYKCGICGNIVCVLHGGEGTLVCCGEPMKLCEAGVIDASREKHVPVIKKTDSGYEVTVGSVLHPSTPEHYIEWIELIADGVSYRRFLNPGDTPTATFCVEAGTVEAREYCNLHGLWKAEFK